MKIRYLLLTLVGLAISLALPSVAQELNAISPKVRQQIEAVFQKFQDAYNARDIGTIAALHTQDAIEVRSWQGLASGVDEITKRFESDWSENPGKMVNKIVALYPIGNAICEIADSDVGGWKAQTTKIYVRQGADWKEKITYVNNTLPTEPVTPQEKQ
jgi:ketosteroid isomerase-like protein